MLIEVLHDSSGNGDGDRIYRQPDISGGHGSHPGNGEYDFLIEPGHVLQIAVLLFPDIHTDGSPSTGCLRFYSTTPWQQLA